MKKLLLPVLLAITSISFGQQTRNYDEVVPCHHSEETEKMLAAMSEEERQQYHENQEQLRLFTQQYIEENGAELRGEGNREILYTVPVVFHIIHAGGDENISAEQVEDCIRIMNEDYQKLNNDWNNVNDAFTDIVADVQVEFKLARKDPQGNCTNGITRTFSPITFGGSGQQRQSVVVNEHGTWPGNRYMNVFVAADIGGAAGYTTYPNFSGMGNGIHVLHDYVGSIGTGTPGRSRTMTHEAGHWFNLPHLWGNSNDPDLASNCNQDDGVSDTPNTVGWTSCNRNGTSCGSLDNVENYMEYSYCSKMFTEGQKARMHAALNSSTGGRSTVVSAANLEFTGVNEPDILCRADFGANATVVCAGQEISFTDYSFHSPSGWEWSFPGGNPSSSIEQNPSIVYNTPGVYEVELTATDGTSSDTYTRTEYITVLDEGETIPFLEDFESYDNLSDSPWEVINLGNNAEFEIEEGTGYTGNKCVKLANFGQQAGNIDEIISAPFDLSSVEEDVTVSFRYAYRRRSSSNDDWLRVFLTSDCGKDWSVRRNIRGAQLSTETASNSWTPLTQDDWTTVHMTNVTSQFWVDNFRVKFQFESDAGNNFYIDDINIYPWGESDLSVDEVGSFNSFNVFPNPASNEVNVSFDLNKSQLTQVEVLNSLGQSVESFDIYGKEGNNLVLISTDQLRSGMYMIRLTNGSMREIKQLIIK